VAADAGIAIELDLRFVPGCTRREVVEFVDCIERCLGTKTGFQICRFEIRTNLVHNRTVLALGQAVLLGRVSHSDAVLNTLGIVEALEHDGRTLGGAVCVVLLDAEAELAARRLRTRGASAVTSDLILRNVT
jgi:hypothetical protein